MEENLLLIRGIIEKNKEQLNNRESIEFTTDVKLKKFYYLITHFPKYYIYRIIITCPFDCKCNKQYHYGIKLRKLDRE